MKIENITLRGFQGFNDKLTIQIHPRMTLIYAANSFGKTSICEGIEWLLYGTTSRVEQAEYMSEYKGSYRNVHTPDNEPTFVEAVFKDGGSLFTFRGELTEQDPFKRFVDGIENDNWPIVGDLSKMPKPFVLQHALKYLLLVTPNERFQGFARLLGFDELEAVLGNIISLCTKPEARIPPPVRNFRMAVDVIEKRLMTQPSLTAVQKAYKRGSPHLDKTYDLILQESRLRVLPGTPDAGLLPRLLKIREEAVGKVFQGRIILERYSDEERRRIGQNETHLLGLVTEELIKEYTGLIGLSTLQHILEQMRLFELGLKLLEGTKPACPLCGQVITPTLLDHLHQQHDSLQNQGARTTALEEQRKRIAGLLNDLGSSLKSVQELHLSRISPLIRIKQSLDQLKAILLPKHEVHFTSIQQAILRLEEKKENIVQAYDRVATALNKVQISINASQEDATLLKVLGEALSHYVSEARLYIREVDLHVQPISDADQILRHELDALAGTQDISVLIDLLEQWRDIKKKLEIEEILEGLKDLRKAAEQYVGEKMRQAVAGNLSSEVMEWYEQIRTTGDPNVHFGGFDMERTQSGEVKARRIQVKATSYGKDLISAVSSLSESKLNALGLCLCIASNLKSETPFEFLVIDDPIQSLDTEHEAQCVEVIRKLVEKGKQVLLLTHNGRWVEQVRSGCRSFNGIYYEITSYNQAGPHIKEVAWEGWRQRLGEIDAILKDPAANSVRIQQAEEEVRLVMSVLTTEIYHKIKDVRKDAAKLNSDTVRKMLIECGVGDELVDKVTQSFATTDDAHHASVDYSAHRQRIHIYYNSAWKLVAFMKSL
ncbi:MAG: AAA family ATPase [Chloroflexi bacterium]|nr:AAA family ATPase [Chloroflexota bacterium]